MRNRNVPFRPARLALVASALGAALLTGCVVAPVPGAVEGLDLEGLAGLSTALAKAATAAPSAASPYYAASSATAASTACSGADLVNPAFVLVAPATDRDLSGGTHAGFDAPNRGFA